MAVSSSSSASHLWYVQAGEGVWGPYTEARMAGFLAEGRIAATTPVSPWSAGPFAPAGVTPEFAALLAPAPAARPAFDYLEPVEAAYAPTRAVEPSRPVELASPAPQAVQPGAAQRPLLVWAFLASLPPSTFEAALGAYGPCVSIRTGLWLVRAHVGAAALRNALSRRLRDGDTLLVVEAPLEQAAWFNLDQVSEHELRRLWIA